MKTRINFCVIWAFFRYKWAHGQRSCGISLISTTFSKFPLLRASYCNFGGSPFQTHGISLLVSFFTLFDYFLLILYLFLGATTNGWKESIGLPNPELSAESYEKKIH